VRTRARAVRGLPPALGTGEGVVLSVSVGSASKTIEGERAGEAEAVFDSEDVSSEVCLIARSKFLSVRISLSVEAPDQPAVLRQMGSATIAVRDLEDRRAQRDWFSLEGGPSAYHTQVYLELSYIEGLDHDQCAGRVSQSSGSWSEGSAWSEKQDRPVHFVSSSKKADYRTWTVSATAADADYSSINRAIENCSAGDVIVVREGVYHEDVFCQIDGITLIASSFRPGDHVIRGHCRWDADRCVLRGFEFCGAGLQDAVLVITGRDTHVIDVIFSRSEGCGVVVAPHGSSTFLRCHVHSCDPGLSLSGAFDAGTSRFKECTFSECSEWGVFCGGSSDAVFEHCDVRCCDKGIGLGDEVSIREHWPRYFRMSFVHPL